MNAWCLPSTSEQIENAATAPEQNRGPSSPELNVRVLVTERGFTLGLEYFDAHTNTEVGFSQELEALLGPRRPPGEPWQLESDPELTS